MDTVLPKWVKSKMEHVEPMRAMPYTDILLPSLAKLLDETELEMCAHSYTLQ